MPTSFLGLTTNTQASGSATTFLTWRLAMNDESNSNATKIDTYAQNISASVTSLQLAVSFAVNATESTTNNYVATVTGFTSYTDKKLINLMLDVTQTGTTTLNINSLGTKTLYKIGSNGTAGNLDAGDLVAGRPNFFMYDEVGGYWLWVNGTSADQINIATTTNTEILLGSASGIVGSGISASSLSTNDGYFLVSQLSSNLRNESQLTAGSGIGLVVDTTASTIKVTNNIFAGNNITLSADASSSAVTITGAVSASSVPSINASYILFGSLDSSLTNDKLVIAGSGIAITENSSASTITISSTTAASSIAPATASYIVLGADSVLTNERVLTAGSNVSIESSASAVTIHNTMSNPNVIINGDFDIWQRGTSFPAIAGAAYSTDRFNYGVIGTAVHTITKDTDVPTFAQSGHTSKSSLKVDCTTADASIDVADYSRIVYKVEGYDYAPLKDNTVTLSFWVKATKIGIYCIGFGNSIQDRSYVSEYTVNTTNTWEKKTITLTLNQTGGTENYTNGIGLQVIFTLSAGSNFQTTANAWQTGGYFATANQVNATDSTDNNFWLSQVKLELGSVATPFVSRPYGEENKLCERYCYVLGGDSTYQYIGAAFNNSTTTTLVSVIMPATMRIKPVLESTTGTWQNHAGIDATGISIDNNYSSRNVAVLNFSGMSGQTDGQAVPVRAKNSTSARIVLAAEL